MKPDKELTDFKHHLVNEAFLATVKPDLPAGVEDEVRARMLAAHAINCALYFVTFIYRGQRGYAYQLLTRDVIIGGALPIIDILRAQTLRAAAEAYKSNNKEGYNDNESN